MIGADTGRHQCAGRDFHRSGVVLGFKNVRAEQCVDDTRVVHGTGFVLRRCARNAVGSLHFEAVLVCYRLKAVGLIVDNVGEIFRGLGESCNGFLLSQLGFDFGLGLIQRSAWNRAGYRSVR